MQFPSQCMFFSSYLVVTTTAFAPSFTVVNTNYLYETFAKYPLRSVRVKSPFILEASGDDENESTSKKGDNKAMAFLRKVGRVGGAANMDFANAMGLDESPSGGTKSSYHEDGFKVGHSWL